MNLVILRGRLGHDPDVRYTNGGQTVARLSLATSKRWTDKAGIRQERTEWHKVVLWDKVAEIAAKYLVKGSEALVSGELQTRQYQDKDGVTRTITEIQGRELELIGGREAAAQAQAAGANGASSQGGAAAGQGAMPAGQGGGQAAGMRSSGRGGYGQGAQGQPQAGYAQQPAGQAQGGYGQGGQAGPGQPPPYDDDIPF